MTIDDTQASRFRTEITAADVEFREQGSRVIERGCALSIHAERVGFETECAVVPGALLRLRVPDEQTRAEPLEAVMEVEQVDVRPGNRFRVSGRLRRAD